MKTYSICWLEDRCRWQVTDNNRRPASAMNDDWHHRPYSPIDPPAPSGSADIPPGQNQSFHIISHYYNQKMMEHMLKHSCCFFFDRVCVGLELTWVLRELFSLPKVGVLFWVSFISGLSCRNLSYLVFLAMIVRNVSRYNLSRLNDFWRSSSGLHWVDLTWTLTGIACFVMWSSHLGFYSFLFYLI